VVPEREASDEIKAKVKRIDEYKCRCCEFNNKRYLEIDHIQSWYSGGTNLLDNMQTLCRTCNDAKGTEMINFRDFDSDLTQALPVFPRIKFPSTDHTKEPVFWE